MEFLEAENRGLRRKQDFSATSGEQRDELVRFLLPFIATPDDESGPFRLAFSSRVCDGAPFRDAGKLSIRAR